MAVIVVYNDATFFVQQLIGMKFMVITQLFFYAYIYVFSFNWSQLINIIQVGRQLVQFYFKSVQGFQNSLIYQS